MVRDTCSICRFWFTPLYELDPFQAFVQACYKPDDRPLKSLPAFVATIGSIAKQIKIRGSSKELRQVATPQATLQHGPTASSNGHGGNTMVAQHLSEMLEKNAQALDALHKKFLKNDSLDKASSSESLGSHQPNPEHFSSLTPKALPAAPSPLPLPAPLGPAPSAGEQHGQVQSHSPDMHFKGLEEYEAEAKQMLSKKKAKELDAAMKRPASKKAQGKAKPKPKATLKKHTEKTKHVTPAFLKGIFGCVRCRGSVNGCDTCKCPYFSGLRFSSREEYNKWYQHKQQGNKRK